MKNYRRKVPMARQCPTGKKTFGTDAAAWEAIFKLVKAGRHEPERGHLRPYQCRTCSGGIHVGHQTMERGAG